jgi:hypothetical protein
VPHFPRFARGRTKNLAAGGYLNAPPTPFHFGSGAFQKIIERSDIAGDRLLGMGPLALPTKKMDNAYQRCVWARLEESLDAREAGSCDGGDADRGLRQPTSAT